MNNYKNYTVCFLVLAQAGLISCSYIKTGFPDKEKDYQFTTEIAPLTLPSDLQKGAEQAAASKPSVAEAQETAAPVATDQQNTNPESTGTAEQPTTTSTPTTQEESVKDLKTISVELVKDENDNHLHIGAPLKQSWRIVDKALSRKAVEVTHRDQEGATFTVQYDPKDRDQKDGSLWDEAVFLFKGFEADEKVFNILLSYDGTGSDIVILDDKQKPVSNAHSLGLLNLLHNTIKDNLAGTTK
jgi:outer membrane protein assembly factor BamC